MGGFGGEGAGGKDRTQRVEGGVGGGSVVGGRGGIGECLAHGGFIKYRFIASAKQHFKNPSLSPEDDTKVVKFSLGRGGGSLDGGSIILTVD